MTSTFSPNLNLQYQGTGDNVNTWGGLLNTAVFANIDQALGGPFSVSVAGSADYTLSSTNALNLYHNPTGILTGSINYIFPASSGRILIVNNGTTGNFSLTVKTAGGTGVIVPQGAIAWVFINSTGNVASIPFGVTTEQNIASATTTDIGSTASNTVKITGTTTITALGSSANQVTPIYFVKFAGALTLTHNGTSLILPGAANITTAANDAAIFEYLGSGNWLCMSYQKASGVSIAGGTPFSDASALVKNSSDATKLAILSAGSISAGTTRTYTLPDKNGTVAMTSDVPTSIVAVRRQVITSTAGVTYTPDAHLVYADVEIWGAGGGGGGCSGVSGAAGGGGGAGGYSKKIIAAATIGVSQTVTLGTGGGAGANTGGNGGTGVTSTFGAILSCTGGGGGIGSTSASLSVRGGTGGAGSGGDINGTGAPGFPNSTPNIATDSNSGTGGSTSLGGAGLGLASNGNANGNSGAANSGSGGSGSTSSGSGTLGGAGGSGFCVITEYCSQ